MGWTHCTRRLVGLGMAVIWVCLGALAPGAVTQASFVWQMEAEAGALLAPMAIGDDSEASGGCYIASPIAYAPTGTAAFSVTLPAGKSYWVRARVKGLNYNADSFFVSFDSGPEFSVAIPQVGGQWAWTWVVVNQPDFAGQPIYLDAGAHTLVLRAREANARLDRLVITDDPAYNPEDGTSPEPFVWQREAEAGALLTPMTTGDDEAAFGGHYVYSPVDYAPTGTASFAVTVPGTKPYFLWARAKGASFNADSFWVSLDGGAEFAYQIPLVEGQWQWGWGVVNGPDYPGQPHYLTAGAHSIVFRAREAHAALDRVVLTDTPYYTPPADPAAEHLLWRREAEEGALVAPMAAAQRYDASDCGYVYAPRANAGGSVSFTVPVKIARDHYLWARVRSLSPQSNSFWFSLDGAAPINYHTGWHAGGWGWELVCAEPTGGCAPYALGVGDHTLRFAPREAHTRLDALLVTSDPAYTPDDRLPCALPTPEPGMPGCVRAAAPLACGQTVSGLTDDNAATDAIDIAPGSGGKDTSGPEVAYGFLAEGDGAVTATLAGLLADLDVYVVTNTCDMRYSRGYGDTAVTFNASAGEDYYIVVDGADGNVGPYSLRLACAWAPGNGVYLPLALAP